MSVEFKPSTLELIQTGETAARLLDAQRLLCGELVEQALKRLDRAIENGTMRPDLALGLCHEIAAYRRIVHRQEGKIAQGRSAARALEDSNGRTTPPAA